MSYQLVTEITILVLAAFVGFEVISKVPTLLHTPLMSGTNAIHGIVIVGAIIVAGLPDQVWGVRIVSTRMVSSMMNWLWLTRPPARGSRTRRR